MSESLLINLKNALTNIVDRSIVSDIELVPLFHHNFLLGLRMQDLLYPESQHIVLEGNFATNFVGAEANGERVPLQGPFRVVIHFVCEESDPIHLLQCDHVVFRFELVLIDEMCVVNGKESEGFSEGLVTFLRQGFGPELFDACQCFNVLHHNIILIVNESS